MEKIFYKIAYNGKNIFHQQVQNEKRFIVTHITSNCYAIAETLPWLKEPRLFSFFLKEQEANQEIQKLLNNPLSDSSFCVVEVYYVLDFKLEQPDPKGLAHTIVGPL